jgi:hypothetical protein
MSQGHPDRTGSWCSAQYSALSVPLSATSQHHLSAFPVRRSMLDVECPVFGISVRRPSSGLRFPAPIIHLPSSFPAATWFLPSVLRPLPSASGIGRWALNVQCSRFAVRVFVPDGWPGLPPSDQCARRGNAWSRYRSGGAWNGRGWGSTTMPRLPALPLTWPTAVSGWDFAVDRPAAPARILAGL